VRAALVSLTDYHSVHNPFRQACGQSMAHLRGKRMSDQVTNKSAAAERSPVRVLEMAPPSSISSSDKLLSRIAILLFILVAGLLTVFGYYASSICITVVLAGFLAILFDPLVVKLVRLHIPRSLAAASIVLAGIGLIGLLGYALYGRAMSFAEELPVYASTIQQTIAPISRKIQNFQQSAGNITNDVHPTKKVPRGSATGIANLA
jgi:predicted PurR-regulated permease PerM